MAGAPTNRNDKIVGRFCETPWRLTQTPYNVEPTLMKGRGGTRVPPASAASKIQERRSRSDTPYQMPTGLWFPS
jgi:hypothetical protein